MKNWPRVALALLLVAGIAAAVAFLPVRQTLVTVVEWIRASGWVGVAAYVGLYVVVAVFMLPGSMMSVSGGFIFGPIVGALFSVTVAVLAGVIPFFLGRFVARDWVRRKAERYPKLQAIDAAVEEHGFKVVLLLRLSLAPYNLLNYALGLTRVRLFDFVVASWLGMVPAVIVLSYLGSLITDAAQLGSSVQGLGPAVRLLYWVGFGGTFIGVVLLTRMARRALKNVLDVPPPPPRLPSA
jgi:uncharacterized membrane protein YdjX (TVP38/TMEM64 family)